MATNAPTDAPTPTPALAAVLKPPLDCDDELLAPLEALGLEIVVRSDEYCAALVIGMVRIVVDMADPANEAISVVVMTLYVVCAKPVPEAAVPEAVHHVSVILVAALMVAVSRRC